MDFPNHHWGNAVEEIRWFSCQEKMFFSPFLLLEAAVWSHQTSLAQWQAVQHANPWKYMSDKIWRGFSGDVSNRDVLLCPLTGDSGRSQERQFCLCCMFIWRLFRIFYWLWGGRHVLSSHFGTHGTMDFTHSGKLHENRLLTCLGDFLHDLLKVFWTCTVVISRYSLKDHVNTILCEYGLKSTTVFPLQVLP